MISIIAQLQLHNRPTVALCFAGGSSLRMAVREVKTHRWNKRSISQPELPSSPSSWYYRVQPPNNIRLQHLIHNKWSICLFFHTGRQRLSPAMGSVHLSVSYDKIHIMWFCFRGNNRKMGWIQAELLLHITASRDATAHCNKDGWMCYICNFTM